jgi:PD-(D/E)XK endonuclease
MPPKTIPHPQFRPKLRNRKSKGEWAEVVFVAKAMALGFTVCKPYGENHRYDFLVHSPQGQVNRVQVKSSWIRKQERGYRFHTGTGQRTYRLGEVDFIVAYVVPEDVWYIVPMREVKNRYASALFPHVVGSRSKFEKYREAWRLLQRPRRKLRGVRVSLQACADPALLAATCLDLAEAEINQDKSELYVSFG